MTPMAKAAQSQSKALQAAMAVLERPWSALILNALQAGPLRFRALAERADGPGDKVLSARLKELEQRELLFRHVDNGPPLRVTYELTQKGRAFRPLAEAIERWGRELGTEEKPRRR
jgi:DNA-binding HxlR family transcriptional regulator